MSGKRITERVTDDELAEALDATGGIYADVAKYIHDTFNKTISRDTVWARITKSDRLQKARDNAREELVDYAESALKRGIREGNMTAVIFLLKTRGKNRGYVERQEIKAEGEVRVVNPYEGMSREELRDLLRNHLPKKS